MRMWGVYTGAFSSFSKNWNHKALLILIKTMVFFIQISHNQRNQIQFETKSHSK